MIGHAVPPVLLIIGGIVLWLSAAVVSAGGAVQTNGITLLVLGIAWLALELRHAHLASRLALLEQPVRRRR